MSKPKGDNDEMDLEEATALIKGKKNKRTREGSSKLTNAIVSSAKESDSDSDPISKRLYSPERYELAKEGETNFSIPPPVNQSQNTSTSSHPPVVVEGEQEITDNHPPPSTELHRMKRVSPLLKERGKTMLFKSSLGFIRHSENLQETIRGNHYHLGTQLSSPSFTKLCRRNNLYTKHSFQHLQIL